jgi:hypothetical protein
LYNIFARTLKPLSKYRRYISKDLEPFYSDDEIAVLGINTTRSLTFKNGRLNRRQVDRTAARMDACAMNVTRIIVTHHPFDFPITHRGKDLVGRAGMAMESFAKCGVDLILSGHLHVSHTGESATRYKIPGHSALLIQAGTATSSRGRGELNAFNIIQIDHPRISIRRMTWNDKRASFVASLTDYFEKTARSWLRISDTIKTSKK